MRTRLALLVLLFLAPSSPAQDAATPVRALVVSGANNHDCEWTAPELERLLEATGRFEVDVTTEPPAVLADPVALARYQVLVLDYNGPRWGEAAERGFLAALIADRSPSAMDAFLQRPASLHWRLSET